MMMSIHLMTMVIMLVPYQACNKDILGVEDDDNQGEDDDHNMKHAGL